jgi:hypothetical protein
MGEKGKCGATVRQAVMQAVFKPCISPPLEKKSRTFLIKKIKKNIKKMHFSP